MPNLKRVLYTTKRYNPKSKQWSSVQKASICKSADVEEHKNKFKKQYNKEVKEGVWPEGMFDALCVVSDVDEQAFDGIVGGTGLVLDDAEIISKVPSHELFFIGQNDKKINWLDFIPEFHNQGASFWCTAFAGCSIGSIFEKLENNHSIVFSPFELFYRSGGSVKGNSLVATAGKMIEGFVLEKDKPTPYVDSWGYDQWLKYKNLAGVTKSMLDAGRKYRMGSFASVLPGDHFMRQALNDSPLYTAIGIGSGYWEDRAKKPSVYSSYHAVVLLDILEDGTKVIFDSLTPRQGFNGVHTLHKDYPILSALSFVDVPTDWLDFQKQALSEKYPFALNHYGKSRVFQSEVSVAQAFKEVLKHHPTVNPYAGREWTVCINALVYGDYTYQDLLNHYTNIRRTGKEIFDLNKKRVF